MKPDTKVLFAGGIIMLLFLGPWGAFVLQEAQMRTRLNLPVSARSWLPISFFTVATTFVWYRALASLSLQTKKENNFRCEVRQK
jgi:hypothetical protein